VAGILLTEKPKNTGARQVFSIRHQGQAKGARYRFGELQTASWTQKAYLELLDWTGRQLHHGKSGTIPGHLAPIMKRLEIDGKNWLETVTHFGTWFYRVAGKVESLAKAAHCFGRKWFRGKQQSAQAFTSSPG
jgi:hypothetical protein